MGLATALYEQYEHTPGASRALRLVSYLIGVAFIKGCMMKDMYRENFYYKMEGTTEQHDILLIYIQKFFFLNFN